MTLRHVKMATGVLLLVTGLGTVVFADYKDAFRRGYQAIERRQWQEAERWLVAAIAEEPREGGERIRITGGFVRDYLPHYYLGVALFNQERIDEARLAWEESDGQGTVRSTPEGRQLAQHLSRPEVIAAQARAAGPAPGEESGDPPPAGDPSEKSAPGVPLEADRQGHPDGATPAAPKVTAGLAIPTELRAAARAYFEARYGDAIELLSTTSYGDARLQVHAHLLRAAARYAMYALDGEKNARLRQLAIEDVLACRTVAPGFQPDRQVFSPRFLQFFEVAQARVR